jgi:transposase
MAVSCIVAAQRSLFEEECMEAIIEKCCGLDVHQGNIVACLLVGGPNERPRKEIRSFGTMTADLLALSKWLRAEGCSHVAMESTGVYWVPVYGILEGDFKLVVGNATHIRNVPGRKTDVKDSEWIADLLRHGLIRPSFVPSKPLRELREMLRYRRGLVESQATERNRLIKLLEGANIKLASVASDVFGVSGRAMLRALIAGDTKPETMADLARGQLRKKRDRLALALDGRLEEHHRFMLSMQLRRIEALEGEVTQLERQIEAKMAPYREARDRLTTIPGVDVTTATAIIAELGSDMSVFPTVRHAAAWAGVCPGNNESAGKHKGQRGRKGNVHLTTALVQAAMAAARKKGSYLRERFWRLKARRGFKRAAVAVAHKILVAVYHMLRDNLAYRDLGAAYLDRLSAASVKRTLVKRLERLGYSVHLKALQPA